MQVAWMNALEEEYLFNTTHDGRELMLWATDEEAARTRAAQVFDVPLKTCRSNEPITTRPEAARPT